MPRLSFPSLLRRPLFLVWMPLCILFSGCFEVLEDITVKANGSGTFHFTMNMSQSKAKLQSAMALDSMDGYKIPKKQDVMKKLDTVKQTLAAVKGVSNVSYSADWDNFIFALKFDFNSVSTLNNALHTLAQRFSKEKKRIPEAENNYQLAGKIFERRNAYDAKKESPKLQGKDSEILQKATYTTVYHFESAVKSCSNPDAKISPNRKNVMLRMNILQLVKGEKKIGNRIEFN